MLQIRKVEKSFNGFKALKGISLDAETGVITGLIGPNGSGKTTLFNSITGVYPMDVGQVLLFGKKLNCHRPDLVARNGIARTYQIPKLAKRMTVLENLLVSPRGQKGESLYNLLLRRSIVAIEEDKILSDAWEMVRYLDMDHLANEFAGNLSGGQLKLLSIGRALMADPTVLLLDEPVAGVNVALIERILGTLDEMKSKNKIILIIEHNIRVISDICHNVYVLDEGEVICTGSPQEIQEDQMVRQAYLGIRDSN